MVLRKYPAIALQTKITSGTSRSIPIIQTAYKLAEVHYPTFSNGYSYDSLGRLIQTIQQANEHSYIRSQSYDAAGNHTAANDNSECCEYNSLGRIASWTDAEGGTSDFRYDYLGNIIYVSDPEDRVIADFKGECANDTRKLTYEYDAANRVTERWVFLHKGSTHPIKVVHYHYNQGRQVAGYSLDPGTNDQDQSVGDVTEDIVALSKTYICTPRG